MALADPGGGCAQLGLAFPEIMELKAEYFQLPELARTLAPETGRQDSDKEGQSDSKDLFPGANPPGSLSGGQSTRIPGFITITYGGFYTLGRDSQTGAKFHYLARITVCGKTALARKVFSKALNESRCDVGWMTMYPFC
ncbi:Hypothetical predicted protein [Podarcis lilfordi]|uniref:KCTD8/12/16 H1 domain-containing protein n=1 Tax=Podarcis lilfordi TaxID=74358 RepID=A0AA35LNA2_9SAUR|nr:Hypothetical predicted protein [Podarcis lilfordi]